MKISIPYPDLHCLFFFALLSNHFGCHMLHKHTQAGLDAFSLRCRNSFEYGGKKAVIFPVDAGTRFFPFGCHRKPHNSPVGTIRLALHKACRMAVNKNRGFAVITLAETGTGVHNRYSYLYNLMPQMESGNIGLTGAMI
jgi:hypothetical protein